MKTKFNLFFMLDIMFTMLITQVSSSQQIEGDSYYYSIIDDNKRISDDWGIFQSVFLAILLIGLIFLWVENSGVEQPETSENRAANDTELRTSRSSVSTQSEPQAQTESTPQSEPSTPIVPLKPLPTGTRPRSPRSRSEPATSVPKSQANLNRCLNSPITIVIDDSEPNLTTEKNKSIPLTPPTPKIRSVICAPKRPNENGESSPKPKTKLRRSLRFCEPEKPAPPLRRSLRLNLAKKPTGLIRPTQLNSSELLYCTEWCEKHSKDRRNRSKSLGRISPGKKQK